MKALRCASLALFLALAMTGCGDDDDDEDGGGFNDPASVVNLTIDKGILARGEQAVVTVETTFDAENIFDDGSNLVIVVRLPNGVVYVGETSEIDTIVDDRGVGAQVTTCAGTGETFLLYDLDENDLDSAENPGGDADMRLTLTVQGAATTGPVTIDAAAEENTQFFACGQPFSAERQAAVSVL